MSRFFRRSKEPRRSSDDDYDKMQYWTPQGVLPAKTVEQQAREVVDYQANTNKALYPHIYRNEEGIVETRQNFQSYELGYEPDRKELYEVPVNSRLDLSKKPAKASSIKLQERCHPNDRGRVVCNPVNDPGTYRGVVVADCDTGRNYGVAGVVYHPEGSTRRLDRAPIEPLDREGRQYLRRFADDSADPSRVTTWPPRDEDAQDLETYEDRYKKVRRPRPTQQPKKR
ncbi:hypothetical protein BKA59DRAFT_521601 [Fusarium tricinctum]|uniref:Uncharacterized protein n=2 Tax=Fusarium tricinctum species complex TaxID=679429 RepID=A0A8K0WG08_9HYPO|nr:hypothetical protein BKA59DRAFT_521601 [Fusarium tricinctum]